MLRQLEYLIAVSETRSFRKAAKMVGVSPPTLSMQLRALEQRLGAVLIDRTPGKVAPTDVGIEVTRLGRRLLKDAQEIREICVSACTLERAERRNLAGKL